MTQEIILRVPTQKSIANTMFSNTRFHSILKGLPRNAVDKISAPFSDDKYSKHFGTYEHLTSMVYAQLSGVKSLRELEVSFNAHTSSHYHLGARQIKRSTLADANQKRSTDAFKAILETLLTQVHRKQRKELKSLICIIDSSPINLKGRGYEWTQETATRRNIGLKLHAMIEQTTNAPVYINISESNVNDISDAKLIELAPNTTYIVDKGYYDFGWWHKIDQIGSIFVTRFKSDAALIPVRNLKVSKDEQVISDEAVTFKYKSNRAKHKNKYFGQELRKVVVERDGKKPLILATNDFNRGAEEIAELYKQRWQVELFFKWIKQRLKIKQFLGHSKNAVTFQLYAAIISYLLVQNYHSQQPKHQHLTLHLFLVQLQTSLFWRQETEEFWRYRREKDSTQNLVNRSQYALF